MGEFNWSKDETPYYVFTCEKCGRWLHVKTTQINKKCMNCRRNHKVNAIKNRAETVHGITPATNRVKQLQDELAQKDLGGPPDLRAENDFNAIASRSNQSTFPIKASSGCEKNIKNLNLFYNSLLDFNSQSFPSYLIEIIAERLEIPKIELKLIIRELIKTRVLVPLPDHCYRIRRIAI